MCALCNKSVNTLTIGATYCNALNSAKEDVTDRGTDIQVAANLEAIPKKEHIIKQQESQNLVNSISSTLSGKTSS